jgi:flavin-dependent dehydrogenase
MRRADTRLAAGRVALVGDAAGLVDPVSGDGMYEAFLSGKLAAAHTLDLLAGRVDSLDAYGGEVTRELARITAASWSVKSALDRFPRTSFALMRFPPTWRVVEGIVLGDIAEPGEARGAVQAPLRLLRALGR